MKYIKSFLVLVILALGLQLNAQIGYQVSLLNSATGEPRANETVSVEVEITNSKGTVICSETKSATTNEFGVLSLQVGNASTFESVDWSKLPLYVSATVDGIMVGKSQILNVPVAEAAKTLVNVDPELICRTWNRIKTEDNQTQAFHLTLNVNKTFTYSGMVLEGESHSCTGKYYIMGNFIFLIQEAGSDIMGHYLPGYVIYENNTLYCGGNTITANSVFH